MGSQASNLSRGLQSERGVALVVAVMTMLLMLALGAAVVITTSSEALIAAGFRGSREAFYAVEAGAESAVADLAVEPDWEMVRNGNVQSPFVDGAPGSRRLEDGSVIDVAAIAQDHAGWHLYAHGFLKELLPGGDSTPLYIVALVAADVASTDVKLHVEALGPRGVRSAVEVALRKVDEGIRVRSWKRAE